MSADEFSLWRAFYALEPWGAEVENWRMGTVCATIVNTTPRGKDAKAFKARDFFANPYEDTARVSGLTAEQREFLAKKRKKRKQ